MSLTVILMVLGEYSSCLPILERDIFKDWISRRFIVSPQVIP